LAVRCTRECRAVRKRARKQESLPPRGHSDVRVKTREEVEETEEIAGDTNESFLFHNLSAQICFTECGARTQVSLMDSGSGMPNKQIF